MATSVDVAVWALKAGWMPPGPDTAHAVAIALAQSNANPGKRGGLFGLGNDGDGQTQTRHAYESWKTGGWDVFSVHRNGSYLLFVPLATAAVAAAPVVNAAEDPAAVVSNLGQGLKDIANSLPGGDLLDQAKNGITILTKAGAWLGNPDNWARVLLVVLGGGMVIGGVMLAAGSSVGPVAGTVAKVAKVVK